MPSGHDRTVRRMGGFKRAFLGYRRTDVDVALATRDTRIEALEQEAAAVDAMETELACLSGMVIEREREIRGLTERLREANERLDRNISSLATVTARLEEIQVQARGQATRIRMKALSEAVEVSRRVQELSVAAAAQPEPSADGSKPSRNGDGVGDMERALQGVFEGLVKVEIGPLGDFSQLVGFEDAAGQIGASEIKVERFSEGRATLSMRLDEPVELLRELEQRSALDFRVRHTEAGNLILDIDEDQGPDQRAA
jgi:hypothetical protein